MWIIPTYKSAGIQMYTSKIVQLWKCTDFPFCKMGKFKVFNCVEEKIERFSDLTVDGLLYLAHVSWFVVLTQRLLGFRTRPLGFLLCKTCFGTLIYLRFQISL